MASHKTKNKELVILLHGWMGDSYHMEKLEAALKERGYDVLNVSYETRQTGLDKILEQIHDTIGPEIAVADKVSFVGFSMGGVLGRMYIDRYQPKALNHLILIGAPVSGCRMAEHGQMIPDWAYLLPGEAVLSLKDAQSLWAHKKVSYSVGVIAGTGGDIFPGANLLLKKEGEKKTPQHDGVVRVDETDVPGAHDQFLLPIDHHFMPHGRGVIEQTLSYLKTGSFDHSKSYKRELSLVALLQRRKSTKKKPQPKPGGH